MAWSWSHTAEAYENARFNLEQKSIKFLTECYAEWKCNEIYVAQKEVNEKLFESDEVSIDQLPPALSGDPYLDGRYEWFVRDAKAQIKRLGTKEHLADWIWERASEQSTCDNGGFELWMCPEGCHKVDPDGRDRRTTQG